MSTHLQSYPRAYSGLFAKAALLAVLATSPGLAKSLSAQAAVPDSVEFARWQRANIQDFDGLKSKFMAMARAVPASKLNWRPMEGTRSFHDVFAHIAAEGIIEGVSLGQPLPSGSVADFDAEEARLKALPDAQLIAAMDQALTNMHAGFAKLSLAQINTPVPYFGRPTLPRVVTLFILGDLHEHLGQLVSYARMNQLVPPWSKPGQ